MLRADYTQSWDRDYRGKTRTTVHDELELLDSFVQEQDLDEDLFEAKALDEDETLQRYHSIDDITGIDEERIYAVAMEYSDDDNGVRLEYDKNPAVHDEFTLYIKGDELFRDDVTAAMDAAATPTLTKAVRDLVDRVSLPR